MGYTVEETDIPARVARGAKLLDREKPGWESQVNWDRFDITSSMLCVLGQVYSGGYWRGMRTLWPSLSEDAQTRKAKEHGFTTLAYVAYQEGKLAYKNAWILEAEKRMNPDPFEDEPTVKAPKLKFSTEDKDRMARALVAQVAMLTRDKSISGLSERTKDLIDAEVREIRELLAKLGR